MPADEECPATLVGVPAPPPGTPIDGSSGWELVWSDEFDGDDGQLPANGKWGYYSKANNWIHKKDGMGIHSWFMEKRVENTHLTGQSTLAIVARKEHDWLNQELTGARMVTDKKWNGDWSHDGGSLRVEVRAKLPPGRPGFKPAIWLLPTERKFGKWPASGEVDLMECPGFRPGKVRQSIHTNAFNHHIGTHKYGEYDIPDAHDAFHVYSMDLNPTRMTLFVDNKPPSVVFRNSGKGWEEWPFDEKFHMVLSHAIGGNWGKEHGIDYDALPGAFEIDYVRVYKKPDYEPDDEVAPCDVLCGCLG